MERDKLKSVGMFEGCSKWESAISRQHELYVRPNEIRTHFERDYTRILHSTAYRRLKHKTQVFFATTNDHVCTRIEHVNHVNSVSRTISNFMGLNSELVDAISIGHDLGHAPFGHKGEEALKEIIRAKFPDDSFWHERNSLRFVDRIETLEGPEGNYENLNLTYGVRDGIVCHCGEVDENGLFPRDEHIDLYQIDKAGEFQPFTWEGCVVKVSDKIAYLGRDIEDAMTLELLEPEQVEELDDILRRHGISDSLKLNNTVLIHTFIVDMCRNSDPKHGIRFSNGMFNLMNDIKGYCYKNIYAHHKVERYKKFVGHIIKELYEVLSEIVDAEGEGIKRVNKYYPGLCKEFQRYLCKYTVQHCTDTKYLKVSNVYDLDNNKDRCMICVDFISGMTDQYAIKKYKESITF